MMDSRYFLAGSLARFFLTLLLCVVSCRTLTQLFLLWNKSKEGFRKYVWLIPTSQLILSLLGGNVWQLTPGEPNPSFPVTRILLLVLMLACNSLLRQILTQETRIHTGEEKKQQMLLYQDIQNDAIVQLEEQWESTRQIISNQRQRMHQILKLAGQENFTEIDRLLTSERTRNTDQYYPSLCQNPAVNALAGWYLQLADKEGIQITIQLDIPVRPGCIETVDLCRIVGNMLENAIEACQRMRQGMREISLSSMISGHALVIVMDNSFDGDFYMHNGHFLSRKRAGGTGAGLASISAVAGKYHGRAEFGSEGMVFKSSVRLLTTAPY